MSKANKYNRVEREHAVVSFKRPTIGKGALKTMIPLRKIDLDQASHQAKGRAFVMPNNAPNRQTRKSSSFKSKMGL